MQGEMAMNTCGTCRYFGLNRNTEYDEAEDAPPGYALCGRIRQYDYYAKPQQTDKVLALDGSGYFAALCVTTDFGCTEWEPKT